MQNPLRDYGRGSVQHDRRFMRSSSLDINLDGSSGVKSIEAPSIKAPYLPDNRIIDLDVGSLVSKPENGADVRSIRISEDVYEANDYTSMSKVISEKITSKATFCNVVQQDQSAGTNILDDDVFIVGDENNILAPSVFSISCRNTSTDLLHEETSSSSYPPPLLCKDTVTTGLLGRTDGDPSKEHTLPIDSSDEALGKGVHKIAEHHIKSLISLIRGKTKVKISRNSSEFLVKDCLIQTAPSVERNISSLLSALQEYAGCPDIDQTLCDTAKQVIDLACTWVQEVNDTYFDLCLYLMDAPHQMQDEIEKFSGYGSQTIYEFLGDFESMYLGKGSVKQKADILYKIHLSDRIKTLTRSISSDFLALKNWLLQEYGDYLSVAETILRNMKAISKPSSKDYGARAEYFLKMESVLQKLTKFQDHENLDSNMLKSHVYSQQFMAELVGLLPTEDAIEYFKMLGRAGMYSTKIMGPKAYSELEMFCKNEGFAMWHVAERNDSFINALEEELSLENIQKSVPQPAPCSTAGPSSFFSKKKSKNNKMHLPLKGWANPKWKIPCPLQDHDHELSSCVEFFSLSCLDKRRLSSRKICWTCLGPRERCMKTNKFGETSYACNNFEKAKCMSCQDCKALSKQNSNLRLPYNVLMCPEDSHRKPTLLELSPILSLYMPEINMTEILSLHQTKTTDSFISKTRPMSACEEEIAIDSSTGDLCVANTRRIIPETENTSTYIMQWLQIGKSKCLCFFDTGADMNMIDGRMAEKERLRVITQAPISLKAVGGTGMMTDYGSYKLNLGPNSEGNYHELTCYGMSKVTDTVPKHDLGVVNDEVQGHPEYIAGEPLPEYVGGSKVNLLLGIKNSAVQPVLLYTLESGISVYRSPFRDTFGSTICYGGSHKSFNKSRSVHSVMSLHSFVRSVGLSEKVEMQTAEGMTDSVYEYDISTHELTESKIVKSMTLHKEDIAAGCLELQPPYKQELDSLVRIVLSPEDEEQKLFEEQVTLDSSSVIDSISNFMLTIVLLIVLGSDPIFLEAQKLKVAKLYSTVVLWKFYNSQLKPGGLVILGFLIQSGFFGSQSWNWTQKTSHGMDIHWRGSAVLVQGPLWQSLKMDGRYGRLTLEADEEVYHTGPHSSCLD